MKKIFLLFFIFILLCPSIALGLPINVAGQALDQDDLIYLLSRQMGVDSEIAALAWTEMNPLEKNNFISHVVDVLVLSEAGSLRGLAFNSDVQRQLKWDRVNTLAKAYIDRVKMDWTVDKSDIEDFYRKNVQRYVGPERILARVGSSLLEKNPRWYPLEKLPKDVRQSLNSRLALGKLAPITGSDGQVWYVEVLEIGGSKVIPLDQVREQVIKDIKSSLLDNELARLKERFSVKPGIDIN